MSGRITRVEIVKVIQLNIRKLALQHHSRRDAYIGCLDSA
jgi:hypothetical protein